jgi:plastocyanin domain-containing protein
MDKTITAAVAVIIVAVVAIFVLNPASAGAGNAQKAPSTVSVTQQPGSLVAGNGTTQTINLGFSGNQYSPAEIRVKQGTKVRIVADPSTLTGCMTTVNIDGYGISKYIGAGDNVIEFTADKAGTFPIHCNMGMGNGKLIVEDSSGSVPVPSQAPAVAKGSGGCC